MSGAESMEIFEFSAPLARSLIMPLLSDIYGHMTPASTAVAARIGSGPGARNPGWVRPRNGNAGGGSTPPEEQAHRAPVQARDEWAGGEGTATRATHEPGVGEAKGGAPRREDQKSRQPPSTPRITRCWVRFLVQCHDAPPACQASWPGRSRSRAQLRSPPPTVATEARRRDTPSGLEWR